MNKKDAAAFVGVSVRMIENYAKQNKLSVRYVRGKTGDVADFDEGELKQLRDERANEHAPRPSVSYNSPETPEAEPRSLARLSDVTPEQFAEILTRAYAAGASEIAQRLPPMLPPASDAASREHATISDLAHKLLLSLPEASRLSGVPIDKLRAAVNSGELATVSGVGRGLGKVRRETLETYVKSLEKKRRKT